MNHPNFTILFVDDPRLSATFYATLMDVTPVELSDTFAMFVLRSGMKLGLWSRHTALPAVAATGSGAEIVFQLDGDADVDSCHQDWSAKGLPIIQQPTMMDFGYTFTAEDPDGHRLRVYAFH